MYWFPGFFKPGFFKPGFFQQEVSTEVDTRIAITLGPTLSLPNIYHVTKVVPGVVVDVVSAEVPWSAVPVGGGYSSATTGNTGLCNFLIPYDNKTRWKCRYTYPAGTYDEKYPNQSKQFSCYIEENPI